MNIDILVLTMGFFFGKWKNKVVHLLIIVLALPFTLVIAKDPLSNEDNKIKYIDPSSLDVYIPIPEHQYDPGVTIIREPAQTPNWGKGAWANEKSKE